MEYPPQDNAGGSGIQIPGQSGLRLSLNEKGCRVRGSIPKYSNLLITRCFIRSLF